MSPGLPEILLVAFLVLLLFGSTRLPKLARSLGQASQEFRQGSKEGHDGSGSSENDRRP